MLVFIKGRTTLRFTQDAEGIEYLQVVQLGASAGKTSIPCPNPVLTVLHWSLLFSLHFDRYFSLEELNAMDSGDMLMRVGRGTLCRMKDVPCQNSLFSTALSRVMTQHTTHQTSNPHAKLQPGWTRHLLT